MRTSALAISFVLLVAAIPALAENPCALPIDATDPLQLASSDSGIGGTGRNGGDESGLGGTGRSGKDESGLGGTGLSGDDESGIGGTGIYGTITAFGSICVNGLRVHYDDETPVVEDGEASSADALQVGQVVAVEATGQGSELRASRVSIRSLLVGRVTDVDRETGDITVMGQRVVARSDANLETTVGLRVVVNGLRRRDGSIDASRIALRESARDGVSGIARWIDDNTLEVGGVQIEAARAGLLEIEDGSTVRASGDWDADTSKLRSASVAAAPALSRKTARLSLEGFVQTLPGDERAWIGGVEIDRASFERVVSRPELPDRVRVLGMRDRAGRVRVDRVDRVNRPQRVRIAPRPMKATKSEKVDKAKRLEKRKKPEKPGKVDKRRNRPRRPERERPPERPPRPPRPDLDRPERIDRPTTIDREINKVETRG